MRALVAWQWSGYSCWWCYVLSEVLSAALRRRFREQTQCHLLGSAPLLSLLPLLNRFLSWLLSSQSFLLCLLPLCLCNENIHHVLINIKTYRAVFLACSGLNLSLSVSRSHTYTHPQTWIKGINRIKWLDKNRNLDLLWYKRSHFVCSKVLLGQIVISPPHEHAGKLGGRVMSLGGLNRPHSWSVCWMCPMTFRDSAVDPNNTQLQTTQHTYDTNKKKHICAKSAWEADYSEGRKAKSSLVEIYVYIFVDESPKELCALTKSSHETPRDRIENLRENLFYCNI